MKCVSCASVELTLWNGRYYCYECLNAAVKDPDERERLKLPKLVKKKR